VTLYLSVEQIIEINADQEGLTGVADLGGIEAAAHRPKSDYFGEEKFPDIWLKAAAYLHGFATTQYFNDANKRTAWFSAVTFLALNNRPLPNVPTVEAEVLVQAVAQDVFKTSEDPDRTIHRAAEWFRTKHELGQISNSWDPRIEYALLADTAHLREGRTLDIVRGGRTNFQVSDFPAEVPICVVGRFHWWPEVESAQYITAVCERIDPGPPVINGTGDVILLNEPRMGFLFINPGGTIPHMFHIEMTPTFQAPGRYCVNLKIGTRMVASLPFVVYGESPEVSRIVSLFGTAALETVSMGFQSLAVFANPIFPEREDTRVDDD
jgi:prophage maintenance system killer protein